MTLREAVDESGLIDASVIFKVGESIKDACEIHNGKMTHITNRRITPEIDIAAYTVFKTKFGNFMFAQEAIEE